MKVLHLSSLYPPQNFGGAEKVVSVLAEAQAKIGHEVAVAFLVRNTTASCVRNGVELLPLTHRNPLWIETSASHSSPARIANKLCTAFNVVTTADFADRLEMFRPDVVHTHSLVELSPLVWRATKKRGIPIVHTLHDYDLLCVRGALFKDGQSCARRHLGCRYMSKWKMAFHNLIDIVVGVSQAVLDQHRSFGCFRKFEDDRLRVIWNPMQELPVQVERRTDSMARLFTFGYLGRINQEKGVDLLIEACRRMPKGGWQLRVAGRAAKSLDIYKAQAAGLPIEFVGFVDSKKFLTETDTLVAPSRWAEPFGLTVLEAFAQGVPVIGTNSGAIPDFLNMVGQGWVVPTGDSEALAERMTAVMRAGRGALPPKSAYAHVLAAVRPERVLNSYLQSYEDALRRHSTN